MVIDQDSGLKTMFSRNVKFLEGILEISNPAELNQTIKDLIYTPEGSDHTIEDSVFMPEETMETDSSDNELYSPNTASPVSVRYYTGMDEVD